MWKCVPLVALFVGIISALASVFIGSQSNLMFSMVVIMLSAVGILMIAAPPNDDKDPHDDFKDVSEEEVRAPKQNVSVLRKVFERDAFMLSVMLAFITIFSSLALTRHAFLVSGIILSVGTVLVVGKIIISISFFKKEAQKNEPAENPGEVIVAPEQNVSPLQKRLESNKPVMAVVLFFTVFLGTGAFLIYGLWAGAMSGFIGLVVLTGIILVGPIEEEPKDEPAENPGEEIIAPKQNDAALEYLTTAYQSASEHCLAPHIDSIVRRSTRLLAYRKEDGVVGEILQTYHVFITQYVVRAADLVRKYWKAQEYLSTIDSAELSSEISLLQTDIESGDASAKKTLDEKMTTKTGLEAMQKKQVSIKRGLGEIAATLEAMETTVVSAEMSDADAKDVRDELQRTLSSTTKAIKETLCD